MADADRSAQAALRGHLPSIESEYAGSEPAVVDLDTGSVGFQAKGSSAVWVPMVR